MAELVGNVLVGQSGGPTSVINASVAGIVAEALNHECIEEIYGTLNGVLGILQEDFIDLAGQSQQQIRALKHTPGAALAKRKDHPHDPPHLILLPEVPFNQEKVLEDIRRVLKREKFCQIVVAEGLVDSDGNYLAADAATDAFGHAKLGGAGDALGEIVEQNIPGVKVRVAKPGITQRAAAHIASKTDSDEAFLAGEAAVEAAIKGETDKMITLVRGDSEAYSVETGLAALHEIANGVKKLPKDWINEDGVSMNFQFLRYAQPLIAGEVAVPYDAGLPVFARLDKSRVEKILPAYTV